MAAVINTKTNFADPRQYALQPVFNLMNDAVEMQLDFLGEGSAKIILVAASPLRSLDSMFAVGETCGLLTFSMGRYYASPVADANNRVSGWRLEKYSDGSYPLQRFKQAVLGAVSSFEARQGPTSPRRSARA